MGKLVLCATDAAFEQRARNLFANLHSQIGYHDDYGSGDFPVDWRALRNAAGALAKVAQDAAQHQNCCVLCRQNCAEGYKEV